MRDEDIERLKQACELLSEHFESVQIFCTRTTDEMDGECGTVNCTWGSGNWFARKGQIMEWLIKEEEATRKEVRNED